MTMLSDAPFTAKEKDKIAAEAFFAALGELEHAEKRAAKHGYNLTKIARRSGLARTSVSKILNGKRPNVTVKTLFLLAHAMGHRISIRLTPDEGTRL
jgi:DNA-binding phage protein